MSDKDQRVEPMMDPGIASVPSVRAVTVERKELKKFDVQLCPGANQPYDIYDRVGFVPTSYTLNNQTTRLGRTWMRI